ncbi:hypothetical protein QTP86_029939, partial [Hemibagrus guttatus]
INAEFLRIPLEFKFLAMLDQYSDSSMKLLCSKGGVTGRTVKNIIQPISQHISFVLHSMLIGYMERTVMGIYGIRHGGDEPVDEPADIIVVTEGLEVLKSLRNVAVAVAMLFGLISASNLSHPRELKSTFEVIQKVFFNLVGHKLLPKVQALKNKMLE